MNDRPNLEGGDTLKEAYFAINSTLDGLGYKTRFQKHVLKTRKNKCLKTWERVL